MPPELASGFGSLPEIAASLRGGALSALELTEAAIEGTCRGAIA
jgi:hypothetical protein